METSGFWQQIIHHPQVGSTNDVAKRLAREGAPEGTAVWADVQTAGRGRLGRRWNAPPGSGLLCSLLFRPPWPPERAHWLTTACALAAADAVRRVAGLETLLKWPNDLVVERGGRWLKLAGVLTETGLSGARLDYVVVGIGLNVSVRPAELPLLAPNATSILAETGRTVPRETLLAALLEEAAAWYAHLRAGGSLYAEWTRRLATLGRRVEVVIGGQRVSGLAEGVDEEGRLLLRGADGTLRRLAVGDVTLAHRAHLGDAEGHSGGGV